MRLDALVLSGGDAIELARSARRAQAEADVVVLTEGARGGRYRTARRRAGRWGPATRRRAPASTPTAAATRSPPASRSVSARALGLPAALALAARCGAACLTGRGPYSRQLSARELDDGADV